jgi:hypothetical protein
MSHFSIGRQVFLQVAEVNIHHAGITKRKRGAPVVTDRIVIA